MLGRQPLVALVGNPCCGKTALFNPLTGSCQKVANYPGVTVEKTWPVTTPAGQRVAIVDLPGTYSSRMRNSDEAGTRDFVLGRLAGEIVPDVIVCVADASNLKPMLALLLELRQTGRPVVLANNMYDIAQRQGIHIDIEGLSRELRIPVVTTVAVRKRGLFAVLNEIDRRTGAATTPTIWHEPSAQEIRAAHKHAGQLHRRPAGTWLTRSGSCMSP